MRVLFALLIVALGSGNLNAQQEGREERNANYGLALDEFYACAKDEAKRMAVNSSESINVVARSAAASCDRHIPRWREALKGLSDDQIAKQIEEFKERLIDGPLYLVIELERQKPR